MRDPFSCQLVVFSCELPKRHVLSQLIESCPTTLKLRRVKVKSEELTQATCSEAVN